MKRWKRRLEALALILVLLSPGLRAAAETPAEELERLRKEQQQIEENIENAADDIEQAGQQKELYTQKKNNIGAQIEAMKLQIDAQQAQIDETQAQIAQTVTQLDASRQLFEDRMVSIYEMSRQSNLSVLLGLDSFSEMLRFSENLQSIAQNDNEIIETLQAQEQMLEQQAAQEQQQMNQLNASQEELKRLEAEYAQALQQADAQMSQAQAEKESYEKASAEKEKEIEEAERRYAEWAAQDDNPGVDFTGGTFVWPLPGYTTNSPMGWRTDPFTGKQSFHRGTDIAAPKGTRIYAAAGGVVSTHADASYGTCVKISHGGGLVTIYAHMSARADGIGDGVTVEQGQLIGYVGSTGRSSGNHLHFEANLNGTPVSVFDYL
ncbi:murein hydrolase activator EnvC [uncultured Ruthenibacterium sp.]|uniref:murein hydrolase activator EnvC family protein n=1 Tax=uncultured Ruthenibacterium sp. TaxID=1905347 RepID=UPI00349E5C90